MLTANATGVDTLRVLVAAGCLVIACGIPVAAARRKLHIPAYVGMAFLAFAIALGLGKLAGSAGIMGTPTGILFSVLFFLLIATAVGATIAIFFYRNPEI